jgi:YbbR domain-containing protein
VERLLANWPAKIISLAAAALLFLFYRINTMEERFFSVPLTVEAPPGLAMARSYPRSVRVTLRGKQEAVFSVLEEDIEAYADFGRFQSEGQYRIPVRVARKGSSLNIEPLDIRVEPAEISVTLEQGVQKRLEVVPELIGTPPSGYDLVQYSVAPQVMELWGARSLLQPMEALSTEAVDLSGRTADFEVEVGIVRANALLRYPRDTTVRFRGIIREAVVIRTFDNVDVVGLDMPAQLQLVEPLPKGSIRLQGTQRLIEALAPGQLRLVIDCGEIRHAGTYGVPCKPDIPAELMVLKYEPQELELTFVEAGGEGEAQ